jgi:midasin
LCEAFIRSLDDLLTNTPVLSTSQDSNAISEGPIEYMLIIAQRLSALDYSPPLNEFIRNGAIHCKQLSALWGVNRLWQEIQAFTSSLHASTCSEALLRRMHPFLLRISRLLEEYMECLEAWAKSLFKFAWVLLDLGQMLADTGFCQPPDGDAAQRQGNEVEINGTGVGEGAGQANISDQIEDASQVEGMQGEEKTSDEKADPDQGDTLEMENDFDGKLEDIDEKDEETEGSEEDEDDEVEDRVEELEPTDNGTVDKKMWEGKGRDDEKNDQITDQKSERPSKESEMAAAEKDSSSKQQNNDQPTNDPAMGDNDEPHEDAEGPDVDHEPNEAGMAMESQPNEEEILDIPEDLDLNMEQTTSDMEEGVNDLDNVETSSRNSDGDKSEEFERMDEREEEGMAMEDDQQIEDKSNEAADNPNIVTQAADGGGQAESDALGEDSAHKNRPSDAPNIDDNQDKKSRGNMGEASQ